MHATRSLLEGPLVLRETFRFGFALHSDHHSARLLRCRCRALCARFAPRCRRLDSADAVQGWLTAKALLPTAKHAPLRTLLRPHHRRPAPIYEPSALPAATFGPAVRAIVAGVFQSVRTYPRSAYRGGNARAIPRATARPFAPVRPTRTSLGSAGPAHRPVLPHTFARPNVGLSPVRNFSTQLPMGNVIANIPLALRALADQDGVLDQRKWNRLGREVRRAAARKEKEKGKGVAMSEARLAMRNARMTAELKEFFVAVEQVTASAPSVLLSFPLEPELVFDDAGSAFGSSAYASTSSTSFRLITPSVLTSIDRIQDVYTDHARLIRALSNRLTAAGVFDDPGVKVELRFGDDGYKEVHITFPPCWSMQDVRQAAGAWDDLQSSWYSIVDLADTSETASSVAQDWHSDNGATFVFPHAPSTSAVPSPASLLSEGGVSLTDDFELESWDSASSRGSYDAGIRGFLDEVEEAQRGRASASS